MRGRSFQNGTFTVTVCSAVLHLKYRTNIVFATDYGRVKVFKWAKAFPLK